MKAAKANATTPSQLPACAFGGVVIGVTALKKIPNPKVVRHAVTTRMAPGQQNQACKATTQQRENALKVRDRVQRAMWIIVGIGDYSRMPRILRLARLDHNTSSATPSGS
jgi:hypothetical protein